MMINTRIVTKYGSIWMIYFIETVTVIPSIIAIYELQLKRIPNNVEPRMVKYGRHKTKITSAIESQPQASTDKYASREPI